MPSGVHQQHLITPRSQAILPEDDETCGHARAVENIERQGDDSVDQTRLQQGLTDEVFIIRFAPPDNGIAVIVKLACFFFYLRLPAKEHALRTHYPRPAVF